MTTSRLRLPREERAEVVASLGESGLSVRAIAAATGVNRETIRQQIASGYPNGQRDTEPVCDGRCATDECVCPADDEDALAGEVRLA